MKDNKGANTSESSKDTYKDKPNFIKPTRITISSDKKQLFFWFGDSICIAVRKSYLKKIIQSSDSSSETAA